MNQTPFSRRCMSCTLACALLLGMALPTCALFSGRKDKAPDASDTAQTATPPVARNMTVSTYRNVSFTGWFDAVDGEGDVLTFHLVSTPARGAVTMAEDGSGQFVYTPYEGKTGRDSFTYVAVDPDGNASSPAKVTISIEKPATRVVYADMQGDPAHKAAVHLADEGVYVGAHWDGKYFFRPDEPISRAEFLSLAMTVSGLEPLEEVTATGFYDDEIIPTWCKGYVSSALMAGAIQGSTNQMHQPVFNPDDVITAAEAAVMLNNLLGISDVPAETFACDTHTHWAGQAAANLTSVGVLAQSQVTLQSMSAPMTRSEAALMLDGALELTERRMANF